MLFLFIPYLGNILRNTTGCWLSAQTNVRTCKTSWYHSDPGLTGTLEMIQEILQSSTICLSTEVPVCYLEMWN